MDWVLTLVHMPVRNMYKEDFRGQVCPDFTSPGPRGADVLGCSVAGSAVGALANRMSVEIEGISSWVFAVRTGCCSGR